MTVLNAHCTAAKLPFRFFDDLLSILDRCGLSADIVTTSMTDVYLAIFLNDPTLNSKSVSSSREERMLTSTTDLIRPSGIVTDVEYDSFMCCWKKPEEPWCVSLYI